MSRTDRALFIDHGGDLARPWDSYSSAFSSARKSKKFYKRQAAKRNRRVSFDDTPNRHFRGFGWGDSNVNMIFKW